MVIQVREVRVGGLKHLDRALEALADEKGEQWKRAAMIASGKTAMRPVAVSAKSKAPYRTGRLRRGLTVNKPRYKYPSKAQVKSATKAGITRRAWRHELVVGLTLKPSWKGSRYPFVLEAGITKRQVHIRNKAFGKPSKDYAVETPLREPLHYMHKALGANKEKVVSVFKSALARNISILASSQRKLATASKSLR